MDLILATKIVNEINFERSNNVFIQFFLHFFPDFGPKNNICQPAER